MTPEELWTKSQNKETDEDRAKLEALWREAHEKKLAHAATERAKELEEQRARESAAQKARSIEEARIQEALIKSNKKKAAAIAYENSSFDLLLPNGYKIRAKPFTIIIAVITCNIILFFWLVQLENKIENLQKEIVYARRDAERNTVDHINSLISQLNFRR